MAGSRDFDSVEIKPERICKGKSTVKYTKSYPKQRIVLKLFRTIMSVMVCIVCILWQLHSLT